MRSFRELHKILLVCCHLETPLVSIKREGNGSSLLPLLPSEPDRMLVSPTLVLVLISSAAAVATVMEPPPCTSLA